MSRKIGTGVRNSKVTNDYLFSYQVIRHIKLIFALLIKMYNIIRTGHHYKLLLNPLS